MKYIKQFAIILIMCFLGDFLHSSLNLPIPGNVMGMLALLVFLLTGIVKLPMIEETTNFMLKHLSFFFVPAGVALITCFTLLEGKWAALIFISFVSTVIIAVVTGMTIQIMMRRRQAND
ncbi:CidA/LrgA family protein [Methanolobus sp. ZRKC3]|uniref:CidA/LrgA family protein n=1 Tax=Methanolobus sp. ZRKC3 TaxID=3125786 RepID=UPI003245043A